MAKIKLTKSAVDAAKPEAQAIELRDTLVPGFLCKITPAGRKVFMLQYRTNAGERRKPALGMYGELTVEQARSLAQNWLAHVRRGGAPSAATAEARIVYNPSDSVPVGWYRVTPAPLLPDALPVGSIVLTTLPADAAALAAQRGYLPSHVPLLKRVGAVAPQHVCIVNGSVLIDGVPVAAVLHADRWGRPLPSWSQCRPLAEGELFLLSATNPASFDSRYFGPVSASAVLGVAPPIRLEPQP